jgi:hypothetical protein
MARSVPPRFPGRWLCGVTVDESDRRVPPSTMSVEGQWTMRGGAVDHAWGGAGFRAGRTWAQPKSRRLGAASRAPFRAIHRNEVRKPQGKPRETAVRARRHTSCGRALVSQVKSRTRGTCK